MSNRYSIVEVIPNAWCIIEKKIKSKRKLFKGLSIKRELNAYTQLKGSCYNVVDEMKMYSTYICMNRLRILDLDNFLYMSGDELLQYPTLNVQEMLPIWKPIWKEKE